MYYKLMLNKSEWRSRSVVAHNPQMKSGSDIKRVASVTFFMHFFFNLSIGDVVLSIVSAAKKSGNFIFFFPGLYVYCIGFILQFNFQLLGESYQNNWNLFGVFPVFESQLIQWNHSFVDYRLCLFLGTPQLGFLC